MGLKGWDNFDLRNRTEKDPRRQLQGKLNRDMGAAFEEIIAASLLIYRQTGIAFIEKTPEPYKLIGGRHQNAAGTWALECVPEKPAQPDFKGTLSGGRSVAFEAKATMDDRIQQSVLTQTQSDALEAHNRLGALAFVLVSIRLQVFFRIPWADWQDMKRLFGRKYMTANELQPFAVPMKQGVLKIFYEVK